MSVEVVGKLRADIVKLLQLSDTEIGKDIYLSSKRKKHMRKHKEEFMDFEKSYSEIDLLLANPDYVGLHPDGNSIQFIKVTEENTLVAVKLGEKLDVRTMYVIKDTKFENYLSSGRIKKVQL